MSKRILSFGLPSLFLMALLACGGGGSGTPAPTPTATSIAYANPTGVPATSYYFNKNTALSTPGSHLVLELFGPATTVTGSGVVLTLNLDTAKATWANVSGGVPVANGTVFANNANGAVIVKGKISGGTLQVVVTERGVVSPKAFTGPLLQVALDLKPGQSLGSSISLTPDFAKSNVLLGDLSSVPDLKVGTLLAQ